MGDELKGGAQEGQRIDAPMPVEALVLIGEERLEVMRIDLIARRRQPPAAFAGEIGPEQLAVAVEHQRRHFEIAPKRRRPERLEQARNAARDRGNDPHHADRGIDGTAMPLPPLPCGERAGVRGVRATYRIRRPLTRRTLRADLSPQGRGGICESFFILPVRPRPRPFPCGRSGRADTCPRPPPGAAHSSRERPRGRYRPRCTSWRRPFSARTPR